MQNEICPFAQGIYCREDCKLFNGNTKDCKLGEKKSDGQFVTLLRSDIEELRTRINNLEMKMQKIETEGKKKTTSSK